MNKRTEPNRNSMKEREHGRRESSRSRRPALGVAPAIAMVVAMALVSCSDDGAPTQTAPPAGVGSSVAPAVRTLSIVDVRSGEETAFTAPLGASAFEASRDGSMIAYADADEDGNEQIFLMDADGSNVRQLTYGDGGARGPSWAPDGSVIVYERDASSGSQIFEVRVASGDSTMLTSEPRGAVDPGGWAPDGGSILYSTVNEDDTHFTAQWFDFKSEQSSLIVPDASTPELSPDGAWIAFNSWVKPVGRLILAKSDGTARHTIAQLGTDDAYEQWSPDSTQLAYQGSTAADGFGTFVYELATGETRFVSAGTVETWIDADHILVS